jgi:hypothetical protein
MPHAAGRGPTFLSMKPFIRTALCLTLTALPAWAGPYAPAAGQPGSTAIHRSDSRILAWANRVTAYQVGTDCLPLWQDPSKALGPATEDAAHITCLGGGGTITLAFPVYIKDGPGADFAVFENSFLDGYMEHAWVEVSRDGVNFVRFPNHSLTPSAVGAFALMDPTDVQGLGCKYRQPYGEPYDLAEVGLDSVSHVRLVDVIGDGSARDSGNRIIYDPFPNEQSAGFDLDAIGVLHSQVWQTMAVGSLLPDAVNATALAHLPDGRFVLGAQGFLSVQSTWGQPGRTGISAGSVEFDPAFLAVRDASSALLGSGGGFGGHSGLHGFNPGTPAQALTPTPLATMANFSAVWWQPPGLGQGGWLIAGTNGPAGKHNITFLSTDGMRSGPVTAELSTFSSDLATDAAGNLYAALYELSGSDAEVVLKFTAGQVESAVAAVLNQTPAPLAKAAGTRLFQFDSAGSLAVDAAGRIWGSGFKTNHLHVYDPSTGASRRIVPDHAPLAGVTDVLYQVRTFSRQGEPYVAFLATDEAGSVGRPILYGLAPLRHLTVPETLASWRVYQFGAANLSPANETALWGNDADPDRDGISNLLEYALTTSPVAADAAPAEAGQSNSRLTLTFSRNPLRPDLRYTVEVSSGLMPADWSPLAIGEAGGEMAAAAPSLPRITETAAGKTISVNVRDALAITAQSRRFLRLRVTLLP